MTDLNGRRCPRPSEQLRWFRWHMNDWVDVSVMLVKFERPRKLNGHLLYPDDVDRGYWLLAVYGPLGVNGEIAPATCLLSSTGWKPAE
jgi:hypothetical protein